MRCFIFGALEVNNMPILPQSGDFVIAADKGYMTLKMLGINPNLIVGDFDSLGFVPTGDNIEKLNICKDDTDTAHAVDIGFEKGFREFIVYGGVGGRLDHSFANIQLAKSIARRGGKGVFIGDTETFTVIKDGSISFDESQTGCISVFSLSDESTGVSEKGLAYTLDNATLTNDNALGVSNEFIGKKSHISVKNGYLLIITQTL